MIRRDIAPEDVSAHAARIAPAVDELWVVEDVPYAGGISQLGVVLAATDDVAQTSPVTVGHGIAPAPFRNPMALAMEWATLARVYPGRLACGIGHGLQTWMKAIGEGVDSPLTLLEETIVDTRALLQGFDPASTGRYRSISGYTLEFPPAEVPAILAGVVGPKSLRLSGRVADGTLLPESVGPDQVAQARLAVNEGRAEAGRTDHHHITVFAGIYCGDLSKLGPPPEGAIQGGWDVVEEDPKVAAARLQTLVDAETDSVVLVPFGPDPQGQLASLLENVVPLLNL